MANAQKESEEPPMNKRVLITTMAGDFHTQGLFNFTRIAREAGFEVTALPPGASNDSILESLKDLDPHFLGLSYRLSSQVGLEHMQQLMNRISESGRLNCADGEARKIAFAGLPSTVELVTKTLSEFSICGIIQTPEPLKSVEMALDFLEVFDARRETILQSAKERIFPPRIELFDQLAEEVVSDQRLLPPLPPPSLEARRSYVKRIMESWPGRPLLRTHYGEPGDTIEPTVLGIEKLAEACAIDELSLGSSDLSQRYYNEHDKWVGKKNDGGVPYRSFEDLAALRNAAGRGNFPAVKPYAHVTNMESFVDECIKADMLIGAHQAVPLYWFNTLDGRGPAELLDSIKEHFATVRKIAALDIPVEMNDPNHWSSRWASDAVVVADYGIISSVMQACGARNMVFQMQFNKPKETSDRGDIAKFSAAHELIRELLPPGSSAGIWLETRTGIDHFEPDLERAKKQLARSTLLQMLFVPQAIHIVSYCEALYAAKPEDIINSSQIIRKAVKVYHQNSEDINRHHNDPDVLERKSYLKKEALFLLEEIAALNPSYKRIPDDTAGITAALAEPATLYRAMEKGYMAAPGIFTEPFRSIAAHTHTDIFKGGFIDSLDPLTLHRITEHERLSFLRQHSPSLEALNR
ncbi:MAG: cobalamin B12-binding domain-containing protein [Candidatus Xenobiia bacterium LiM19]